MEKVRSKIYYKGMTSEMWTEAVSTAMYLVNHSTNMANSDVTPYELSFKKKPELVHLRLFGSQGYAYVDDVKRMKLDSKLFRCIFIGYAENLKGYHVYESESYKTKVVRSVQLDEREVPRTHHRMGRSPMLLRLVMMGMASSMINSHLQRRSPRKVSRVVLQT